MKILLSFLLLCSLGAIADNASFYILAKSGLNLRATASTTGKVLTTIAYGEEVTVTNAYVGESITLDGMNGFWSKVRYKGQEGYLVNLYLSPEKMPVGITNTLDDYFSQLSTIAYKSEVFTNTIGEVGEDEGQTTLQKVLYKNGMEIHQVSYYESGGATYFFPNWTREQVFQLLKQIKSFKVINDYNIAFPTSNKVYKKGDNTVEVKVNAEGKISITYEEGAYYEIYISYRDSQIVVEFSSGV